MPYDVPLILSLVIFFFAILGLLSAVMEKESPVRHLLSLVFAIGLFYYAWHVAGGDLQMNSVSDAFLRIVNKFS